MQIKSVQLVKFMRFLLALVFLLFFVYVPNSIAAITKYVDEEGVMHFVDVPVADYRELLFHPREVEKTEATWFTGVWSKNENEPEKCIVCEGPAPLLMYEECKVIKEVVVKKKPMIVTVECKAQRMYFKTLELCKQDINRRKAVMDGIVKSVGDQRRKKLKALERYR